jgi:hypothetical protein
MEKSLASRCRGFSREGKPEKGSQRSAVGGWRVVESCQAHLFTESHDDRPVCVCVCAGTWSGTNKEVERRDRRCFSSSPAMACRCLNGLVVRVSGRLH